MTNISDAVKEAVKKIGKKHTPKLYESKSYGDLTILTLVSVDK